MHVNPIGLTPFVKIIKASCVLVFSFFIVAAEGGETKSDLLSVRSNLTTISKEAVIIPSVKILDDVILRYFSKSKIITAVSLSEAQVSSLHGEGGLNPDDESFFKEGDFFAVDLDKGHWILIFREVGGNRYRVAKGFSVESLIFQKTDFQYFSKQGIPNGLIDEMNKHVSVSGKVEEKPMIPRANQ